MEEKSLGKLLMMLGKVREGEIVERIGSGRLFEVEGILLGVEKLVL